MGNWCSRIFFGSVDKDDMIIDLEEGTFIETQRNTINNTKFVIKLNYKGWENENSSHETISVDVIHVDEIESTMPASEEYIRQGNILPFIYNAKIQTKGRGQGDRKWEGGIGNLYTSTGIPKNMIKNEFSDKKIIIQITAISIIQQLNKYAKKEFYLKHPNDILCKDKCKLGGILVEDFNDFFIIGFGINIVNKPEENKIRQGGLSPCFVKHHLPEEVEEINPLDLSIEVTKNILYNLQLSQIKINQLFEKYLIQS